MSTVIEYEIKDLDFAVYPMDTTRGAPMGRTSGVWTNNHLGNSALTLAYNNLPFKLQLRWVPLNSGAYDKGGAYWGFPNNVYVAYCLAWLPDVERELEVGVFVRAHTRKEAKQKVLEEFPNATFYR